MPANFQATYTPISVAGTEQQISHLSRLMATQMTAQNLGKGVEEMMKKAQLEMIKSEVRDSSVTRVTPMLRSMKFLTGVLPAVQSRLSNVSSMGFRRSPCKSRPSGA